MVPRLPWRELALVIGIAGCGVLPADAPVQQPRAGDPDLAAYSHTWKIADHVLATSTSMTEADATAMHGRTIELGAGSYASPWHGRCEEAGRRKGTRVLADLALDLDLAGADRQRVYRFGLDQELTEYTLSCTDLGKRTPPFTLFVVRDKAMTCFGGVCYLLAR